MLKRGPDGAVLVVKRAKPEVHPQGEGLGGRVFRLLVHNPTFLQMVLYNADATNGEAIVCNQHGCWDLFGQCEGAATKYLCNFMRLCKLVHKDGLLVRFDNDLHSLSVTARIMAVRMPIYKGRKQRMLEQLRKVLTPVKYQTDVLFSGAKRCDLKILTRRAVFLEEKYNCHTAVVYMWVVMALADSEEPECAMWAVTRVFGKTMERLVHTRYDWSTQVTLNESLLHCDWEVSKEEPYDDVWPAARVQTTHPLVMRYPHKMTKLCNRSCVWSCVCGNVQVVKRLGEGDCNPEGCKTIYSQ